MSSQTGAAPAAIFVREMGPDGRTPIDQRYVVGERLGGRGQAGFAAFCYRVEDTDKKDPLLIKADTPATCLAEASASVVPTTAAVFARIGCVMEGSSEIPAGSAVSIQPKVMPRDGNSTIVGLDVLILGKKREPKTAFSAEWKNEKKINTFLARLSPEVQKQMAEALYASRCAGDHSVHSGQWVCEVNKSMGVTDKKGKTTYPPEAVMGMHRIDFGAAFRHMATNDADGQYNPLTTPPSYASSGQVGKDYLTYFLQNPKILRAYANRVGQKHRQAEFQAILNRTAACVYDSLQVLSPYPTLQKEAIGGMIESLTKSMPEADRKAFKDTIIISDEPLSRTAERLASAIGQLVVIHMKNGALHEAVASVASAESRTDSRVDSHSSAGISSPEGSPTSAFGLGGAIPSPPASEASSSARRLPTPTSTSRSVASSVLSALERGDHFSGPEAATDQSPPPRL